MSKPIGEVVAANINRLLREKDMRPVDLARAVKVDPSTVTGWQSARTPPTLSNLQRIGEAFGVPVRRLVEDPEDAASMGMDVKAALRMLTAFVERNDK